MRRCFALSPSHTRSARFPPRARRAFDYRAIPRVSAPPVRCSVCVPPNVCVLVFHASASPAAHLRSHKSAVRAAYASNARFTTMSARFAEKRPPGVQQRCDALMPVRQRLPVQEACAVALRSMPLFRPSRRRQCRSRYSKEAPVQVQPAPATMRSVAQQPQPVLSSGAAQHAWRKQAVVDKEAAGSCLPVPRAGCCQATKA